jgi:hypothetical protein
MSRALWARSPARNCHNRANLIKVAPSERQKVRNMRTLELTIVIAAAAALAIWRGVAMYRYSFKKKDL